MPPRDHHSEWSSPRNHLNGHEMIVEARVMLSRCPSLRQSHTWIASLALGGPLIHHMSRQCITPEKIVRLLNPLTWVKDRYAVWAPTPTWRLPSQSAPTPSLLPSCATTTLLPRNLHGNAVAIMPPRLPGVDKTSFFPPFYFSSSLLFLAPLSIHP